MDLLTLSRVVSAIGLVIGVFFGLLQLRQYAQRRRRENALELVHSFQTPAFAKALEMIFRMPDGLDRRQVEEWVGEDTTSVLLLISTWESLGILVHRRELDIELIDDFFSGPIALTWRKLERYMREVREQEHRSTFGEWAQWLAERMQDRESTVPPVPAYVAHRDWRP